MKRQLQRERERERERSLTSCHVMCVVASSEWGEQHSVLSTHTQTLYNN